MAHSIDPLVINIEKETLDNEYYRRVVFTGAHSQTVLMNIPISRDIPREIHDGDQFIRIEKGTGIVELDGVEYHLYDGVSIDIPAGTEHYVKNTGRQPLKLYTKYCPPEHSPTLVEQLDAEGRIVITRA